jgi:lipid-binding SYLF domain-containing protein
MRLKHFFTALLCTLTLLAPAAPAYAMFDSKPVAVQRAEILKQSAQIMQRLYGLEPHAKELVAKSAGYATFSNFGMKIFLAGGGSGSGVVMHKGHEKPVYMKMVEVQAGLGVGIKSFSVIFVFETEKALNSFINSGWEFGGQATAAAKYENKGGAYEGATNVSEGVWMYQLTDSGLAAEITAKGTKYYQDTDLNK